MLRRWLLAPVLRELDSIHHTIRKGFRTMTKEMDDLTAAETELADEVGHAIAEMEAATVEIERLTTEVTNASPSGVETIVEQIKAQTARLRAARQAALPAAPVAAAPAPAVKPVPVAPAPEAPMPPAVPDPSAPVAPTGA